MARARVSLKGVKAFQRRLNKLTEKEFKKALRTGLRQGAKKAVAVAKQRVPEKTGTLKRSLKVRATKRSRVRVGVKIETPPRSVLALGQGGPTRSAARVLTGKGYYPAVQEFGSSKRNIPERNYLRQAHANAVPGTIRAVKREIIKALRRAEVRRRR